MEEQTKYAAVYCRVSSEEQRQAETIENQIDFAKRYCDLHGYKIVNWYKDDGISGTLALEKRPAGRKLLIDLRTHKFDILLVLKIDRLARNTSLLLDINKKLEEAGIALKSMTETFDTGSPTGKFTMTMFASMAELERETILERTAMGKERNLRKGKWPGGSPPTGYRINGEGYLDIEEEGAKIIRDIFRLYTEERLSTQKCAEYLNAKDIPTASQLQEIQEETKGIWRASRISRVLSNKVYKGEFVYREGKDNEIRIEVPAIVSKKMWEQAARLRSEKLTESPRSSKRLYLLRGLIKCGHCGLSYIGDGARSRKYTYYRCNGSKNANNTLNKPCDTVSLRAELIEQIIWEDIEKFIRNPGPVVQKLQARLEKTLKDQEPAEEEMESIEAQIEEKQKGRARVVNLCRRGLIDEEETEKELVELQNEIDTLKQYRDQLFQRSSRQQELQTRILNAEVLLKRLQDEVEDASPETKRRLIKNFVESITVNTLYEDDRKVPKVNVRYHFDNIEDQDDLSYANISSYSAGLFEPKNPKVSPSFIFKFKSITPVTFP